MLPEEDFLGLVSVAQGRHQSKNRHRQELAIFERPSAPNRVAECKFSHRSFATLLGREPYHGFTCPKLRRGLLSDCGFRILGK
jgi:hypothetical protein